MSDERGRTSLTPFAAGMRDIDPAAITKIGALLWHRHGLVCVDPKKFKSFADEKQAEILAELAYGPREKGTQDG
jgi:hypothetical protein